MCTYEKNILYEIFKSVFLKLHISTKIKVEYCISKYNIINV